VPRICTGKNPSPGGKRSGKYSKKKKEVTREKKRFVEEIKKRRVMGGGSGIVVNLKEGGRETVGANKLVRARERKKREGGKHGEVMRGGEPYRLEARRRREIQYVRKPT